MLTKSSHTRARRRLRRGALPSWNALSLTHSFLFDTGVLLKIVEVELAQFDRAVSP